MFGSAALGFPEPGLELVPSIKYGSHTEEETVCYASALRAAQPERGGHPIVSALGMMSSHCVLNVSQLPTHMCPWLGKCISVVLLSQLAVYSVGVFA